MSSRKDKKTDKTIAEMGPKEIAEALTGDTNKEFLDEVMPLLREVVGVIQLATAGNVEKVEELMTKPGNLMEKLLQIDQSMVLGVLQARGLWYLLQPVAEGEKITHRVKLDWANLLKDLAIYSETKQITKDSAFGPIKGPASKEVAEYHNELLQEVVGDSEESGQKGPGQGGN